MAGALFVIVGGVVPPDVVGVPRLTPVAPPAVLAVTVMFAGGVIVNGGIGEPAISETVPELRLVTNTSPLTESEARNSGKLPTPKVFTTEFVKSEITDTMFDVLEATNNSLLPES